MRKAIYIWHPKNSVNATASSKPVIIIMTNVIILTDIFKMQDSPKATSVLKDVFFEDA